MAELVAAEGRPGTYQLRGSISFTNVHTLNHAPLSPAENGCCTVDLSQLDEADSSVLALLLGWLRKLRASGHQLQILGVSASLESLIHLYNLDSLLLTSSN